MDREVDRGDDLARLRADRRGDRPQAVGELLVVDGEAGGPDALELGEQILQLGERVRAALGELHLLEHLALRGSASRPARSTLPIDVQ